MEMQPVVFDAAGIYNRDGRLVREVTILPTGQLLEPLTLAAGEVLYPIMRQGERRWLGLPFSMDTSRPPWARDAA